MSRARCPECGAKLMHGDSWCTSTRCDWHIDGPLEPMTDDERAEWRGDYGRSEAAWDRIKPPPVGVIQTDAGQVRTDGLTAVPQKRWRGWRDRQPQRNPVTVKRVGK